MHGRGERSFIRLPRLGARLYESLTRTRGIALQEREIAWWIGARLGPGRLLDAGCGPGGLLKAIQGAAPDVELFGLDISWAMVGRARRRLAARARRCGRGQWSPRATGKASLTRW